LRNSCLNRDRFEKMKRDKRKGEKDGWACWAGGGAGWAGLAARSGRALAFMRRSDATRVGGRLGWAWSGQLFCFLISFITFAF
jgi:hypothetical protein